MSIEISYSWHIRHLVYRDLPDFPQTVYAVSYSLTGETVTATGPVTSMELGEKLIPQGDLTLAFTPFESLQESQVVNWLMAQFTVEEISQLMDAIKARLEQQVEATQPKYAEYLPWMAQDDPRNPRTTPANYVAITFPEVYDPSA